MEKLKAYLIALRNLIIGSNLFSLAFIFRPKAQVGIASTLLFYQKTLGGKRKLEQKNPHDVIESIRTFQLNICTDSYFWGNDPSYAKDIIELCVFSKLLKPRTVFEIGTLDGYTALHFAMNTPDDADVYTLDLPPGVQGTLKTTVIDKAHQSAHAAIKDYKWRGSPYERKIHCLFGDSATFDYSPFYGKVDLFFIDGAHSYEYVRSDTINALKCISRGGWWFGTITGEWG